MHFDEVFVWWHGVSIAICIQKSWLNRVFINNFKKLQQNVNLIFETCKMRAISHHKENFIEDLGEVIDIEHIAHLIESADFFI